MRWRIFYMRNLKTLICLCFSVVTLFAQEPSVALTTKAVRVLPGMKANGQVQLPTQWSLHPTGKQIPLGDFPVNIAIHPSETWCAILHAGYGEHEVVIVDLKQDRIVSRASIPQAFYGLAFDPTGTRLFASGGEHEVIHRFTFKDGFLVNMLS